MVYKSLYGYESKMTSWFPLLVKLHIEVQMLKGGFTVTLLWSGVVVHTIWFPFFSYLCIITQGPKDQ